MNNSKWRVRRAGSACDLQGKEMKALVWYVVMAVIGVGVWLLGNSADVTASKSRWHMPTAYPMSNYQSQTAQLFADEVLACTNGKLEIVIHAGGSLFKGHEIKRAVRTGQAQIGERLLSAHSNENAMFAVDSIPFVASSFSDAHRLDRIARPALEAVLAAENLVLLYSVIWPPQGIYFRDEVHSVEEVAGQKFRAYNATTARVAELAGMIPIQIEAAEMSQALATGVVSSFMASGSSGYDSKVWEHIDYFYDVKAWLPRNSVFVNKDIYDGLSGHVRQCLHGAAEIARLRGNEKAVEMTTWYIEQLLAEGMRVVQPGEVFRLELAHIGRVLSSEWSKGTGQAGDDILKEFYAGGGEK